MLAKPPQWTPVQKPWFEYGQAFRSSTYTTLLVLRIRRIQDPRSTDTDTANESFRHRRYDRVQGSARSTLGESTFPGRGCTSYHPTEVLSDLASFDHPLPLRSDFAGREVDDGASRTSHVLVEGLPALADPVGEDHRILVVGWSIDSPVHARS